MQNCWSDKYFVNMMKTYRCLIRIYWRVSHSNASPTYIQNPNLFITVPLDVRVLDGTRSSAVAVFITKSHIFHWLPPSNSCLDAVFHRHTKQAQQRQSIKKHTNGWNWTVLTHWGREKMAAIFQHIFVNANIWISIKISLKFVPKGQINNILALGQIMALCRPSDKPLSDPNRTTRTPAFWGYPRPPHDYPYYLVILDPESKEDNVKFTNLKNLRKIQIFIFWNYTELDAKRRKYASAIPLPFTPTCSPDNAKKPQTWPVSVKGAP